MGTYERSSHDPTAMYPALFTRTSILPWISIAFPIVLLMRSWLSVTSSARVDRLSWGCSSRCLRLSSFRLVAITRSPRSRTWRTISSPKPDEHPVMSQTSRGAIVGRRRISRCEKTGARREVERRGMLPLIHAVVFERIVAFTRLTEVVIYTYTLPYIIVGPRERHSRNRCDRQGS